MILENLTLQTGVSNSRSKCQNFGLLSIRTDFITVTGWVASLEDLHLMADFVAGSFADDVFEFRAGQGLKAGRYYESSAFSVRGIVLAWHHSESEEGGFDYRLSIPGKPLRLLDEKNVWRVCFGLRFRWKAKATRFDVACDDYSKKIFQYDLIHQAGISGSYTGFRKYQPFQSFENGELKSWSLYFGSSESEKRIVFYDKTAESGGEIDAHRLEVRLRESRAALAFEEYTSWAEDCAIATEIFLEKIMSLLSSILVHDYDFIDRKDGERASRCDRLQWWQDFLLLLERVDVSHLTPKRTPATMDRVLDWLNRQVAPTVAMCKKVLGTEGYNLFWQSILASGEDRWGSRHRAFMNVCSREWSRHGFV